MVPVGLPKILSSLSLDDAISGSMVSDAAIPFYRILRFPISTSGAQKSVFRNKLSTLPKRLNSICAVNRREKFGRLEKFPG